MKVAFSEIYRYLKLPPNHRFPMEKYDLLPKQLLHQGIIDPDDFFEPTPLSIDQVLRTHTKAYIDKLLNGTLDRKEIRNMGFPFHESLVKRGFVISGGTLACARYAIKNNSVGLNIAGGTHHSYADRGEGFCLLNDFAITANELLYHKEVNKVLIIDLDVHQGNGTAKIFENNPQVFTFSVHGEHNYPLRKETSDLDIGVKDGIGDEQYLAIIKHHVPLLLKEVNPDLVLYLSGVDILKTDKLGRLGLTKEGCRERDRIVFKHCKNNHLPVAVSMGGGYSEKIGDIIDAHANTFIEAKNYWG